MFKSSENPAEFVEKAVELTFNLEDFRNQKTKNYPMSSSKI